MKKPFIPRVLVSDHSGQIVLREEYVKLAHVLEAIEALRPSGFIDPAFNDGYETALQDMKERLVT